MAKVYIRKETPVDHLSLLNDTGVVLEAQDFAVIGGFVVVADQRIPIASEGSFAVAEGLQIESKELKTNEDAFATLGNSVYWDKTEKKFSDTANDEYYRVGYVTQTKDAQGVIVFDKLRHAQALA